MAKIKPVHPGEILFEDFLEPLNMSTHKLAMALHVSAPGVYDIISGKQGISAEMALRLGRLFNTTPDFWANLQSGFDLRMARIKKEAEVNQQVQPLKAFEA
jgi:addiction module HigA family antidote